MKSKITGMLVAFIAVAVLVIIVLFRMDAEHPREVIEVPSPNEIMYGIKYECDMPNDASIMRANILSDEKYKDYEIRKLYKMIYQIRDEESEREICEYLGIKGELPTVDYRSNYLLLSVGCLVDDISRLHSISYAGDEADLLKIRYDTDQYYEGKVYVYSMKNTKLLAGKLLDMYYWENASDNCNLVENPLSDRIIVHEGPYSKVYLRSDNLYEIILQNKAGETVSRKSISNEMPVIKDISDTMTRISYLGKTVYFNAKTGDLSREYDYNTEHLIYNIITHVRLYNGETQLILRDAYDSTFYSMIVRLPFATVEEDKLDSLIKSISVVDDNHINVEYLNENNEWVTETVEVYNMNR